MAKEVLDFTNVKDRSEVRPIHQEEGEYIGKVIKWEKGKSKKDGAKMWVYLIKAGRGTYALYCKLDADQLWKIRNLFVACGVTIPKKRVNVDPERIVGMELGVVLEDDEYEGKMKSTIAATLPLDEITNPLSGGAVDDGEGDDPDTVDDDEDEDEEEEPKPKKKKGKKGKKQKAEVDEDELEEIDIDDV